MNTRYRAEFDRLGLGEVISSDYIFESRAECIAAYRAGLLKAS